MSVFCTEIAVRIGEINYGQHLGHDRLITLLHQARLDFLHHLGGSELSLFGVGLIMRRLEVDYLGEAFLNDLLRIEITAFDLKQSAFALRYAVFVADKRIATAQTQMVGFDYGSRKIQRLPEAFHHAIAPYLAPTS